MYLDEILVDTFFGITNGVVSENIDIAECYYRGVLEYPR